MVKYDRTQDREHVASAPVKICIVGIGGAGLNVLDRIALDRIVDASLIGMHTDVRVLSHAMTQHKLQLGTDLMRGIGSGGDPELGRSAAENSAESIRSLVQGHDMVFICAGLGGGTGSGAVPVVAQIAKECGALVFIFATTPFSFEGRRRLVQAEMALEQLQSSAEALILFENNRMGELVLPREGIQKAFSQADQIIGHSVRAITSMVIQPGLVRLGLSDLMSALRSPNARCLFGFGEARGTNRVAEALKKALKSPLIHQGQLLQHSHNLIVHVAGGDTLTLVEVEGLMKQLGKHIPDQTQILFGISVDPKLGDSLALTLLSSLSAQQLACEMHPAAAEPAAKPLEEHAPITKVRSIPAAARQQDELERVPANGTNARSTKARNEVAPPAAPEETPELLPAPAARQKPAPEQQPLLKTEIGQVEKMLEKPVPVAKTPVPAAPPAHEEVETEAVVEMPVPADSPAPEESEDAQMEAVIEEPPPVARTPVPADPPAHEEVEMEAEEEEPLPAARTPAPADPPAQEEEPVTLVNKSIFSVMEEETDSVEDDEETALPASKVVPKPRAQPRVQPRSTTYAPPSPLKPEESFEPEEELEPANGMISESPAPKPEPALAAAGRPGSMLQPTLNLHQEEIARFKGTDKTIVEGEDLDVPTWMRMRQKVRR